MKFVLKIVFILIFITSCDNDSPEENKDSNVTPTFVTTLNPADNSAVTNDISENVIQGIASFENGWFVTQRSGEKLLINYLNANGESLFDKRFAINSHGQDLSLEQTSANELLLYTSVGTFDDIRNTGVLALKVSLPEMIGDDRDWSAMAIIYKADYNLDYSNSTPTLSEDKNTFAIRSNNTIHIHSKNNLITNNFNSNSHFQLNNQQLRDNDNYNMWFQGIAMKDNLIYCLAGNSRLTTHKNIFAYNLNGTVSKKWTFDITNFDNDFGIKFEPEALNIKNNELFFTIMTKKIGVQGNIKYLYKISI